MLEVMERPRRKRLWWESRCEIVARIESGVSPRWRRPVAARAGRPGIVCGGAISRVVGRGCVIGPRRRGVSRGGCRRRRRGGSWLRAAVGVWAGPAGRPGRASALDDRQGAASSWLLAAAAAGRGRSLRAPLRARRPGELLHIDTKRLGRFWEPGKRVLGDEAGRPHRNRRVGWQHLHVAIDDHSRLAYAELLPGQDAESCARFLERATSLVSRPRPHHRARPDRQRQGLPLARLDRGHTTRVERRYTALPTTHQRQSRTADPNPAPRMGLRTPLPIQQQPRPRAGRLSALV